MFVLFHAESCFESVACFLFVWHFSEEFFAIFRSPRFLHVLMRSLYGLCLLVGGIGALDTLGIATYD